jgi:hypothetical protein
VRHVLWIGGASASGKTAVAARIARRHGLRLYNADTRTWVHRDRAIREGNAAALRWEAMTPEERWTVSPGEMLEMSLHRERGPMVVDDLQALPRSPLVVAEGTTLPAGAVVDRSRAVWLIPTTDFQQARLEKRELAQGPRVLYLLLTEAIAREADEHGVRTLPVDGSRSIDATVDAVERLFADALAEGPCAETLEDRCALLREANEAVVAQVRGYYGRPWAHGDPDEIVRTFVCECGDRSCEEMVQVPVRAAAAAPVVTGRHA